MPNRHESREAVRRAISEACETLIDRETLVELVVLCAVAGEHLLVIGPPGTGKSEAVRRITRRLGGRYFEYLIGRFTEPTELFGPIDLRKLKEGIVETETSGMLPEADIAFLDEVFLGSTAILNTLLSLLNERTFRRGHTVLNCPLRVCVGASNRLPDDEQLAAFADRFLVRVFVEPVPDTRLEALLGAGWSAGRDAASAIASMADVDELARAAYAMDLGPVRPAIAHAVRALRGAGVAWTDRRIVRMQRLIAAAAALAGRERTSEADLWPMVFALPTEQGQLLGREVLRTALEGAENESLLSAAADGSLALGARGAKLLQRATVLLGARPAPEADARDWHLQLEGVAREIDATFTTESMPEGVSGLRARVVEILGAAAQR